MVWYARMLRRWTQDGRDSWSWRGRFNGVLSEGSRGKGFCPTASREKGSKSQMCKGKHSVETGNRGSQFSWHSVGTSGRPWKLEREGGGQGESQRGHEESSLVLVGHLQTLACCQESTRPLKSSRQKWMQHGLTHANPGFL